MIDFSEPYEPSEEERMEIEELFAKEEEHKEKTKIIRNRVYVHFNSEDHWIGWLRTHGIKW